MKIKNACFALLFWTSLLSSSITYAQITGSGTTDFIPLWTSTKAPGDSAMFQTGGKVGIGTRRTVARLNVVTTSTTTGAITGNANATSVSAPGVFGTTASRTEFAAAVYGLAAGARITFGVYGGGGSLCGHAGISPMSVLANVPTNPLPKFFKERKTMR
jgi:hypothetical protein